MKKLLIALATALLLCAGCTKIEQPELDGKPIKRPVNIVR